MRLCSRCECELGADSAVICWQCTRILATDLRAIPAHMLQLEVTVSKLARVVGGSGPDYAPEIDPVQVPFHVGAARVKDDTRALLRSWAKLVAETNRVEISCADEAGPLARWLLGWVRWLRQYDAAGEAVDEIHEARRAIVRAIDRPPRLWLVGECDCGWTLWAREESWTVTCRNCEKEHEAYDVQMATLRRLDDRLMTAAQLSRAFRIGSEHLTPDRIRKWRNRGHLEVAACDVATKRELYRPGDVAEVLAKMPKRVKLTASTD